MSNLPEISMEKYVARWQQKAVALQDELFKTETLAEALLEERNERDARIAELEASLAKYESSDSE